MSNIFNLQTNHPLIKREQDFVLDRKLVSIHSEDRDIVKWPSSSCFEIDLPQPLENVQSVRLVQCSFPINYHTFSTHNQNTKMSFQLNPTDKDEPYYTILKEAFDNGVSYTIEIQSGTFCPEEIVLELEGKMNEEITYYLHNSGMEKEVYKYMNVFYDKVENVFWFGNPKDEFIFLFDKQEEYNLKCNNLIIWYNYTNWGLGSNLGFHRKVYKSEKYVDRNQNPKPISFSYTEKPPHNIWLSPVNEEVPIQYIKATFSPNLIGDKVFYMEMDKFNSYDEIKPYAQATNSSLGNDYSAVVNSAFAKIPVLNVPVGKQDDSRNNFLQNLSHYDPPIKKVSKLKFRFRYHDGRLVDFQNNQFNFTIEFNQIRNEIYKKYNLRIPSTYNL